MVRLVRQRAGLSLAALAARSGVTAESIRNVETASTVPTLRTLTRIVAGAGCRLRLGVEWPGEPVRVVTEADWAELRRAAGTARRRGRPAVCTPSRVLAYLRGRPGATTAQVAYAFGVEEAAVRSMVSDLVAAGQLEPALDEPGAPPVATDGAGGAPA